MSKIFISHTSSDLEWAEWISQELTALGHTPFMHEWEIGKGENILAWMNTRHGEADHVLCVVSEAYLKASYSTWEREAGEWRAGREQRAGFMLYVVVAPCVLPPLVQHFKRCKELYGVSEDVARQRFRAFMAAPAPPLAVTFPRQDITAESNITIAVPRIFMGRDDDMATIEAALKRYHGRAAITALRGMRGVGKTVLAAAYAAKHRHDYRATWWLRAETADGIRTDLAALGHHLGWVADGEAQDAALAKIADRLRREGEGILLIFDNALDAESIRPFLPLDSAAHVLITSNAHRWGDMAEAVEIRLWPTDIGAAFLLERTGSADKPAAEALSAALDGLPLAHEMAAAYCEELGLSLAAYLARFTASPAEVLGDADSAPASYHDRLTVAKAFALAIEAAAARDPAAEKLLVAAATLPPEPIPLFLFAEVRATLAEGLAPLLEGRGLERAVAALRRFALVEAETIPDEHDPAITTETIRLHRLIRMAALWRRDAAAATAIDRGLFAAFVAVYPKNVFNPQSWPHCRRLDAIATALLNSDSEPAANAGIQFADMLIWVGQYRQQAAAYRSARPLFERALAINERLRGPGHPQTGVAVANLALLLQAQGDLAAARPLFERDLAITEKVLGAEHPDTAISLNNLASLLQDQDDLAAARPLYERALGIREKVLGAEHPDTATSLNNLALLLQAQGDLAAARPLHERDLAISEKVLGAEHPDTATSLNNLAGLLQAQGDLAAARPLFERALGIREKVLGAEHPDTAASLDNLARLLQAQGDLAAARPLFERALAIHEKALGAEHPDTAISLNNLASLLQAQGDLAAARPLFERALAIREKVLGAEHPDTAASLNNLASLLQDQGDLAAARPLSERALAIAEKVPGAEHPSTAIVLRNLANLRRAQGEAEAALPLFARALGIVATAFGPTDPRVAHTRNELALTLLLLRRTEAADAAIAETCQTTTQPHAIVAPATALLAVLAAAQSFRPPAEAIGRLKTLLLGPALPRAGVVPHIWRAHEPIATLAKALPDPWPELAPALLAAINDPTQAPALDRFPLWRSAAG